MNGSVFITGTDTEIGKTVVARLLVAALVQSGEAVAVMKPVAAGCEEENGEPRNQDAMVLMAASNVSAPYELVNPYAFMAPISPHLAAAESGFQIELARIKSCFKALESRSDRVVVEGVGGWYVPLSEDTTVADLVLELGLPAIMVIGMRLGCLNHALLTEQAIRTSGVRLLGWVANCMEFDSFRLAACVETLRSRISAPLLSVVPKLDGFSAEHEDDSCVSGVGAQLADAVGQAMPTQSLAP